MAITLNYGFLAIAPVYNELLHCKRELEAQGRHSARANRAGEHVVPRSLDRITVLRWQWPEIVVIPSHIITRILDIT